jgi:hypothetical protein
MKVQKKNAIQGWWFASEPILPNGDGRKVDVGKTHHIKGGIEACSCGLHSSRRVIDALQYNHGPMVYMVESWGDVDEKEDKLAASNRKYIAVINAAKVFARFSRWCALSVIHLWEAPEVVIKFLKTGNEKLRAAAGAAAWAAAGDAAWAAAWAAAGAAAWAAARDAAGDAARDAAGDAAWAAAGAAAGDAAGDAAWAAAGAAAGDAQNKKLESMLRAEIKKQERRRENGNR